MRTKQSHSSSSVRLCSITNLQESIFNLIPSPVNDPGMHNSCHPRSISFLQIWASVKSHFLFFITCLHGQFGSRTQWKGPVAFVVYLEGHGSLAVGSLCCVLMVSGGSTFGATCVIFLGRVLYIRPGYITPIPRHFYSNGVRLGVGPTCIRL